MINKSVHLTCVHARFFKSSDLEKAQIFECFACFITNRVSSKKLTINFVNE